MRIQLHKSPRTPHYFWHTHPLFEDDRGIICHKTAPRTLVHQTKGKEFIFDSDVLEFYWKEAPFSLHCAREPDTHDLFYYCNIHSLPEITADRMDMVDLDLDVIKVDTAHAEIVDQDEFETHIREFGYSPSIQATVPDIAFAVADLLDHHPLFSKAALLELFQEVEQGRASIQAWTQLPEITRIPPLKM